MTQPAPAERSSFRQALNRPVVTLLVLQLMGGMLLAPHFTFFPLYVQELGHSAVLIASIVTAKQVAGLIASLVDCHGTGTAAAAAYRAEGREMDTEPPLRFVTASLHVDYIRPTPLGPPLEIRGRVVEIKARKVVVAATVSAAGEVCARGKVVAVRLPEGMAAFQRG